MHDAGQPPRHVEVNHHTHDDADVREDFRTGGEFLPGRYGQGLPMIGVRGFPMPQA